MSHEIMKPRGEFLFFAAATWPGLIEKGTPLKSILKVLGKKWADIEPKSKGKYATMAMKDKVRYKRDVDYGKSMAGPGVKFSSDAEVRISYKRKAPKFLFWGVCDKRIAPITI